MPKVGDIANRWWLDRMGSPCFTAPDLAAGSLPIGAALGLR